MRFANANIYICIYAKCTRNRRELPSKMQLSVHERIIMKNAFNDERLDRWRGVLHGK